MVGKICPMGGSVLTPDLNATSENFFLKGHFSPVLPSWQKCGLGNNLERYIIISFFF